jgi:hypothetical protein
MAVKDLTILNLTAPATVVAASYDYVGFTDSWVYGLTDATDTRLGWTYLFPGIQKVIVCPAGAAYPGDAALGLGGKRVTINFASLPSVTMNQVENVDTSMGWALITKGDFVIAYSPLILSSVSVFPSI